MDADQVSFDTTTTLPERASLWRLDLPADVPTASEHLRQAENQLSSAETALDDVPLRIDTFIDRYEAGVSAGVSFDISAPGSQLEQPEGELLRWLQAVEPSALDYGIGGISKSEVDQAREQFQGAVKRILRMLVYFAWVETQIGEQLLARTVVNWSGDTNTVWGSQVTSGQMDLHNRSLDLALRSRNTMLQTILVVMQGATKLSVLLTSPAGAVLAIPVAWKYVNQILAQIEKHKALSQTI